MTNIRDRTAEYLSTVRAQLQMQAADPARQQQQAKLARASSPFERLRTGISNSNSTNGSYSNGNGLNGLSTTNGLNGTHDSDTTPLLDGTNSNGNINGITPGKGMNGHTRNPSVTSSNSVVPNLPQQSQFTEAAGAISKNIFVVSEKLEKLTHLAKQRSMFDDPVQDINKLTYIIKSDLQTLDKDIDALAVFAQRMRGNNPGMNGSSKHAEKNSLAIVKSLKNELAHTTKTFTEVLQVRTKNLKDQNSRRKNFEGERTQGSTLKKRQNNPFGKLLQISQSGNNIPANGIDTASSINLNGLSQPELKDQTATDGDIEGGEQEQQLAVQDAEQDVYLGGRADALQQIETTLVELAELYKRLLLILAEQDQMTIRIDDNMTTALENVDSGHATLLEAFKRMSSNTWLIIKVFLVLLLFAVVFVVGIV
jgi:syntaxin 5